MTFTATYHVDGPTYDSNKNRFKQIIKLFKLKWIGGMSSGEWKEGSTIVRPDWSFKNEVKVDGTIMIQSENEYQFDEICKAVISILNGEKPGQASLGVRKKVQKELDFYIQLNTPNEKYLRDTGMPEEWIEKEKKNFKEKVKEKEHYFRMKYDPDYRRTNRLKEEAENQKLKDQEKKIKEKSVEDKTADVLKNLGL